MVDRNVSSYYNGEDNFQDEMPYDLYNMVEMYKKISKASILPNFGEIQNVEKAGMLSLSKFTS